MTSTSFNPIQMQTKNVQLNQPLTLKQGQVFHGTIKQLYPDQMAEVQVGSHKLIAKLEVPLKVGDAHFFQVTNTNAQTELKVVTGPMTQTMTPTQQLNQLLDSMNLPKTSEMQQVMSHFMKEQVPISKGQLVQAEAWMKNLAEGNIKQDALVALQRMIELKMPFTKDVFQALIQGAKTDGISATLANLAQLLANQAGGNEALKSNVLQQIQALAKPFDAEIGGVILARAMQTLTDLTAPLAVKTQALTMLKEMGVLPQSANLQNWSVQSMQQISQASPVTSITQAGQVVQQIMNAKPENSMLLVEQVKSWISNESLLTSNQKEQLQQLVQRFTQLPQNKQTLEVFAKQMQEQFAKAFSENTASRLFTQNDNGLSTKDQLLSLMKPDAHMQTNDVLFRNLVRVATDSPHPAVQTLLTQSESQVQVAIDSKAMEQAMKTVLKGLGISYEAALSNKSATDVQVIAQQLKPQLLALIQDVQTPSTLKDSAETVIARMNGMQLLSSENGHQHQLVMQVPLEFFGKKMDATLQWNGRMKDDGKIDANYARVLFYLQMASLQETVVDMQVQNRVITINVFNDNPNIDVLAEPLKQTLKQGLGEKEYHLSGVFIKPFEKSISEKGRQNSKDDMEQQSEVDIRV
ncbi:hypothetical protein [Solibacillus sp. FSL H8-0538]|uniref:hypothetical protein n=1 Tax=Solibacillus sp. FSL H8-0538 TaxID=2921400 RepID=UPI0030F8F1EB